MTPQGFPAAVLLQSSFCCFLIVGRLLSYYFSRYQVQRKMAEERAGETDISQRGPCRQAGKGVAEKCLLTVAACADKSPRYQAPDRV